MLFEVTEVHIHFISQQQGLFALARIVLNDALVLEGIGVHRKRHGDGYRLTYPTRNLTNGQSKTVCHPITPELSHIIETAIFEKIDLAQKEVERHDRYHPTEH